MVGMFSQLKPLFGVRPPQGNLDLEQSGHSTEAAANSKGAATSTENDFNGDSDSSTDKSPNADAQEGVQRVEAITLVWNVQTLALAYAL